MIAATPHRSNGMDHKLRRETKSGVIRASPVGQRTLGRTSGTARHASSSSGSAA